MKAKCFTRAKYLNAIPSALSIKFISGSEEQEFSIEELTISTKTVRINITIRDAECYSVQVETNRTAITRTGSHMNYNHEAISYS
ncbi:hypothetical protein KIN20_030779 [Parelaphostrongylus tenuis]|uniref:Uncharacterized protein n=1 Tax=Parelaphostrongylus tenuis TaxID=148309 RepID=A0AAD5R474_PARTN|nr:hypothetical protein KIN20_030779 [Parelaphostrongylus tenuis]